MTADYWNPASVGTPLRADIRLEMESAFGADFSAVRIHTDSAAAAAAQAEGALAFTTGRDVYFDAGRFAPAAIEGKRLLAHELTHVLQQTGRLGKENKRVATPAPGCGEIQRQPKDYSNDRVPFLTGAEKAFEALATRHGGRPDADESLKGLIERMRNLAARIPIGEDSVIGQVLLKIAKEGQYEITAQPPATGTVAVQLTAPALGFLIDCLKVTGLEPHFEAAALLLDADTTFSIKTAFGPRNDFRDYLKKSHRGDDWLAEAFKQDPLKPFWTFKFVNTVEQFVFSPWRPIQSLEGFDEAKTAAFQNINGDKPDLLFNDRMLLAFELLELMDHVRMKALTNVETRLRKRRSGEPDQARRMHNAEEFLALLEEEKTSGTKHPQFLTEMLAQWKALATKAAKYWLSIIQFGTSVKDALILAGQSGLDLSTAFAKMDRPFAADDPLIAPLRTALMSMGTPGGLFFLNDTGKTTDIPTPEEYQKRISALEKTIDFKGRLRNNFLLSLQQELIKVYHKGGIESPAALALGWVMLWTSDFATSLSSYSLKTDDRRFTDLRLAHRYVIASRAREIAQVAQWPDLLELSSRILRGRDVEASYLAVVGRWQVKPDVPVSRMITDLPGNQPIEGYGGLQKIHVVHFFAGNRLEQVASAVNEAVEKARRDPKEELDAKALQSKLDAVPRPWRAEPENWITVLRDEDQGKVSNMDLLRASPKSKEQLTRLSQTHNLGPGSDWIALLDPPVSDPVFVWMVPDMLEIIRLLKNSKIFQSRMEIAGFGNLPDIKWLEKLLAFTPTSTADILAAIDERVKGQTAGYYDALRQLTALRRRNIATKVRHILDKYKPTAAHIQDPKELVDLIWHFRGQADPREDGERQQALLVLSVAVDLNKKFDNARHAVELPPFFHETLTDTLKFVTALKGPTPKGATIDLLTEVKEVLFRNDQDPSRAERIEDFLVHEDEVKAVAKHMEEARVEMQERYGFESEDGKTLKTMRSYVRIEPGSENAVEIDGHDWELVKVHGKFTYHPALDFAAQTSTTKDPIIKKDGKKWPTGKPLPLATFLIDGDEVEVIANDPEESELANRIKLKSLSDAIFWYSQRKEMGNLGEALEDLGNFMIEVMELIPAIGQEVMIAKFAGMVVTFIGEVPHIVKVLKDDPFQRLNRFKDELTTHLPETLITFFILGEGPEPFATHRAPAVAKTPVKLKGKIAKVLAVLRRIGRRLADALRWIRLRVAGPVRSLQSSIVTRPKLAWLLRRAVDIAFWLSHLELSGETQQQKLVRVLSQLMPIDAEPPPGVSEEEYSRALLKGAENELSGDTGDFKTRLTGTLDHFGEGVLPAVLIPVANVIGWLIDFFLSRMGAKVRLVKSLVENTKEYRQLHDLISEKLAGFVENGPLDPNKYWQEYIVNPIDEQVRTARNELIARIYSRTNVLAEHTDLAFLGLGTPDKKGSDFGLKREGDPMEEQYPATQAYTLHGALPKRARLGELPTTPGQPLAAAVRLIEERRFGHDLKHVRLHTGAESESNLKRIGANAVTSGSHVFFRPGLDPQSALGARVLRHELTHVLQQTGPRPKGRAHATRPLRGRPRAGLILDQMREAAADAMANADSAVARKPVEVEAGAEGVQADLEESVTKVLGALTTVKGAEDFDKPAGKEKVPGENDAEDAWHAVVEGLKEEVKVSPFAKTVVKQLTAHIKATVQKSDMRRVAALAQQPGPKARGKGKKPRDTTLDFSRFVTLLEGFIFAKSGVAVQLKLSEPPKPKLIRLEITYVHLGFVNPGPIGKSPLWDEVMKNTDKIVATGDEAGKVRFEIHERLRLLGPDPFIWKTGTSGFRFSADFVESFNKVRASRKPDLAKMPPIGTAPSTDPKVKPPTKDEYLNPSGTAKRIGLLIGEHQEQKGLDRESHHTTQYLLIQFFRNNNRQKAWQGGKTYPGIYPTRGEERQYFRSATKGDLDLQKLDPGGKGNRGLAMPAILISADLHRRGQLHVERETRWTGKEEDPDSDDEQGRATQGFAIQAEFKRQLIRHLGEHDESASWSSAIKKADAADKIFDAMLGTYRWMRTDMLNALERGLKTRELAYYRAIISRNQSHISDPVTGELKPNYNLKAEDMNAVFARTKANNDLIMGDHGWTA
jgi:hypothetical protein